MWETWVLSLGWKDPLKKEKATYYSILAWRIPWAEKPDELESMESQRVRHSEQLGTAQHIMSRAEREG